MDGAGGRALSAPAGPMCSLIPIVMSHSASSAASSAPQFRGHCFTFSREQSPVFFLFRIRALGPGAWPDTLSRSSAPLTEVTFLSVPCIWGDFVSHVFLGFLCANLILAFLGSSRFSRRCHSSFSVLRGLQEVLHRGVRSVGRGSRVCVCSKLSFSPTAPKESS